MVNYFKAHISHLPFKQCYQQGLGNSLSLNLSSAYSICQKTNLKLSKWLIKRFSDTSIFKSNNLVNSLKLYKQLSSETSFNVIYGNWTHWEIFS